MKHPLKSAVLALITVFSVACRDRGGSSKAHTIEEDSGSSGSATTGASDTEEASSSASAGTGDSETSAGTGGGSGDTGLTGTDTSESSTGESEEFEGEPPACDGSDSSYLDVWLDGFIPGLPTDSVADCLVTAGADPATTIQLMCTDQLDPAVVFEFGLALNLAPQPTLPANRSTVELAWHKQPSLWQPMLFSDIFFTLEEEGGEVLWSFQMATQMDPVGGVYASPWNPSLTENVCGPYQEDSCGEKVSNAIRFIVDGAGVTVWDRMPVDFEINGRSFAVWPQANAYTAGPEEFCDVPSQMIWFVTRRKL